MCGAADFSWSCNLAWKRSVTSNDSSLAAQPPAGAKATTDFARPRRQHQRNVAAERVADQVRDLKPRAVHRVLDRVSDQGVADLALKRRPAGVAEQRRREYVVMALEFLQHELQLRQVSMNPCRHTSGDPEPPRCDGVKPEYTPRTVAESAGRKFGRPPYGFGQCANATACTAAGWPLALIAC